MSNEKKEHDMWCGHDSPMACEFADELETLQVSYSDTLKRHADAVRALEAQLEQALLDRDALKALTLRQAREIDALKGERDNAIRGIYNAIDALNHVARQARHALLKEMDEQWNRPADGDSFNRWMRQVLEELWIEEQTDANDNK